ncbi:hypothetical protein DSO57_1038741 [Entomophthora muscae]|nr:hypothetical protein DSO57_1038741 [Entomophthora muscae]
MQSSELLSFEEKYSKMTECWNLYNQAYIEEKLSRKSLKAALYGISPEYRVGTDILFEICEKKALPLLIFSAGVTDVIEVLLEESGLMKPHVHVLSNAMIYSPEEPNLCVGFTSPPIHILNKGETPVSETPHYDLIALRKNIILLGDSLGDLQMSKTIPHEAILTVGFLNHDVEKNMNAYTKSYDIVIIDDSDFGPVNQILSNLH